MNLEPLPQVISLGAAWEEILSNLIFNAVDAMPQGGDITLSTRQVDADVEVRVTDNGTGMDAETKRRVFEPFFTTKDAEHGSGLGLSTVWGLIQGLGGSVRIDSELGAEGLSLLERESFELVISDWIMPGINGMDVAEKVKERASETVMIIMTGWDYEDTPVEQSPQVDLILAKPFDRDRVNLVLNEAAFMRLEWAGALSESS